MDWPVALPAMLALLDDVAELLDVDAGVADGVEAVTVRVVGACGWKARMAAVPAIVALRTMGDRRTGVLPFRR
jgi:hypothetical protein